ncbi:uncharacterized protein LOC118468959 [Anopheles albimanus]|uniref:Uncharacterized protein n=1 Tax=Anopheles albimanus TaxID=7167 RepID=A0A182F1G1_ANOAL|nr:uncharacterized protein LOC118468959 [Anopheles albimanus]
METGSKSEIKIKEKLNQHVKKRLQEGSLQGPTNEKGVAPDAPRNKRQKTKNGAKKTNPSQIPAPSAATGTKCTDSLLSPGAANSNDTTNSSINSTDQDTELNDREVCDRGGTSDKPVKSGKQMDIFSLLLNQKKGSLMRDPEVLACLNALSERKK